MTSNLLENALKLKRIYIEPKLPDALKPLSELAHNIWWCWDHDAIELFKGIDEKKFIAVDYNPIALLDEMGTERATALVNDADFIKKMKAVVAKFRAYMDEKPTSTTPGIGYFCMEYGLHQSLRLYSGGLGVLAGDYLKEASDRNINLVAVGLLYRYGYFQQHISLHGDQIHNYDAAKFTQLPLTPVRDAQGDWVKVFVNCAGRSIWAKVWQLKVGRISLYLLDTDFEDNRWEDRSITHQLYGGDNENRLRQELILGVGGARALHAMGIKPDIYHLNEGHAAFLSLERIKNFRKEEGFSFEEAIEAVKCSQMFTTHTPVPAGHDVFPESLLKTYIYDMIYDLDVSWADMLQLGKEDLTNESEPFSMSQLAITTSVAVNGVSKLHGEVSQKMFNHLYPDFHYSESHIGYVTNSVHLPTWVAAEWMELYKKTFGKDFEKDETNPAVWGKIHQVPDTTILGIRRSLKKRLLDFVKNTLQTDFTRRGDNPRDIFEVINSVKEDALVIGFARKAHPADKGGQALIKRINEISHHEGFKGRVIFLENYSMEMAKVLVQGVDIWLNNPTRPKEASGTSGMKAVLNGVMNFSVLDGWWVEGYRPGAGWALPMEDTYTDTNLQNELDAETIYNMLENEIVPMYYDYNDKGISPEWVKQIKNTIADIAPIFTMKRMLDDYFSRYYQPIYQRSSLLKGGQYSKMKELLLWKSRVKRAWPALELVHLDMIDTANQSVPLGGCGGSVLRYLLGVWLPPNNAAMGNIPYHTLLANVEGCLLVGMLAQWLPLNSSHQLLPWRWLLITGFCGGFTTMSSFSLETIQLIQAGNTAHAAWYFFMTLTTSLGAVLLGAAGFIGAQMVKHLNQAGYTDLLLVDDFEPRAKLHNWCRLQHTMRVHRNHFVGWLDRHHAELETVLHLGARTDTTELDTNLFDCLNLHYTQLLWNICAKHQIPFFYASSAATYGAGELGYVDKHQIVSKLRPLNPYGASKNDFDIWALKQPQQPPRWAGFKFFNVYGPGEAHKGRMASVVFHTMKQIAETSKMRLFRSHRPDFKDGEQSRDFVYVKDVTKILHWCMTNSVPNGLYNLGTGKARTFFDLAKNTFLALGLEPNIEFIDTPADIREAYQYFTEADMTKLRKAGYKAPFYTLEEGIADYVGA
ncbi:unnamed protein product, partial [Darwinula stevensoni]